MTSDLHGLVPCLRREVLRGWQFSGIVGVIAMAAVALATRLHGDLALVPGGIALLGAVLVWFGPLANLGADRLHGHLEFDRTLPIALRVMAAGRLLGAAIRILPLLPAVIALFIGFHELIGPARIGDVAALVMIALVVQLLATMLLWLLMALNARWSFRRLWWVPPTFGFLPQVAIILLPDSAAAVVEQWASAALAAFTSTVAEPQAAIPLVLAAVMLSVASFSAATMLLASGLSRYEFDPTLIGAPMGRISRIELGSIGRGPLLAVARLRLRLATEQFRRELVVLVVLFLVAAFGPEWTRPFARAYIPILAALLPAGIAFQLFTGRMTGELEGMQQLPHPASTIGLGHLLAIAVMALPGAVTLQLLHAMDGAVPTVLSVMSSWAWFVTIAWTGAAVGLWFRPRYLGYLGAMIALALGLVLLLGGEELVIGRIVNGVDRYGALRGVVGPLLPFGVVLLAVVAGVPLFASGLSRYAPRNA